MKTDPRENISLQFVVRKLEQGYLVEIASDDHGMRGSQYAAVTTQELSRTIQDQLQRRVNALIEEITTPCEKKKD